MRSNRTLTKGTVALLAASVFLAFASPANAFWPWDDKPATTSKEKKNGKKVSTLPAEKPTPKRKAAQATSVKVAKAPTAVKKPTVAKKPAPARKAIAVPPVGRPYTSFPNSFSEPARMVDNIPHCPGSWLEVPVKKTQRFVVVGVPGLTPRNIQDPHQRFDFYGWDGRVLGQAKKVLYGDLNDVAYTFRMKVWQVGTFTGSVISYDTEKDLEGSKQDFTFTIAQTAKCNEEVVLPPPPPAPAPTVQPLPAPLPTPVIPMSAKVVAKPKEWLLHAKGNQDFYSPGGAGAEYTDWELGVEKKFFDPERYGYSFVSTMVRAGGTPDSFGYFLPGTDDPTIQLSGHVGQQDKSGKDLLALGIGLNAETHFGRAGGFSKWPVSLIGRAAKQFRTLGTRFNLESQIDYNLPNYIGGKVDLEVGPADWPVGVVGDIAGVYIAEAPAASSSALPRIGLNWHISPDITVSGRVGYNSRNGTLGIPAAAVTARF